jgi:DNA-binding transcriptional LysR family regulator
LEILDPMRDLDLTNLRLFVAVCDHRNIVRAATEAHLTASAVSKRLAQLEAQIGTPLLTRRRHGVEPTPAGESLREHARELLLGAQRIERDMAAFAAGVRGQVRLLATASVMAAPLADDVAGFLARPGHDGIQVELASRSGAQVVQGIRDGVAALGICWHSPHGADLRGLAHAPYRSDRLGLVVPRGHALAGLPRVRLAQAMDNPFVGLPVDSAVQALMLRAAAELGHTLRYRMMPVAVAQPRADSLGLAVVPLDEDWAERRFAICYRDEADLGPAARLLLDHLVQQAAAAAH